MSQRLGYGLDLHEEAETTPPRFRGLTGEQRVLWDYRTSRHSVRGHPLAAARAELRRRGLPDAKTLNRMRDGRRTEYAGLVICRQQPGTATGVTFYTLEDETGFVNFVVWRPTFEKYSILARSAVLLGVTGKVQSENGVVHLIADELWDPRLSLRPEGTTARSFH